MTFPQIPVWAVTQERRVTVMPAELGSQVLHYSIPNLEETGGPVLEMTDDIKSQKVRLYGCEVLVSRLNPRKGRVVEVEPQARFPMVASTEFIALTPTAIYAPFLKYALLSEAVRQELDSQVRSVTRSHQRVDPELISRLVVPYPSLETQYKVAEWLDHQVSRIEKVVQLRNQQIDALEHRAGCATDFCLMSRGWHEPKTLEPEALYPLPDGWRAARLSQVLLQLTNGYVGPTRDILVDAGVRYIQGMHIKGDEIDFDRRHFFVTPEWHAARPRIHLRAGDVLVVQTGDIGKVAVVPPNFGEASCHALQILRVRPEIVSGEYLSAYLGSSFGYHSLLSRATGALHPHLEGGIRSVPVVLPPLVIQAEVVEEVTRIRRSIRQAQAVMREQVALLEERKRSLITAAVAGEFEVAAASGSRVVG